ncbi:hypothetical protein DEO72_LG3g745 [Vigna unguiculata]|uniref:Uncharacterized protein n=1 Tax=Vigna unguiculata TaxID=3917 RepID=A0A4D6LD85_VIGUN|nr:hypothetical protein DEO72_LG3g745 [Vigna unguiculata]
MKYENEIGSKGEQSSLPQASLHRSFHETVRKNDREGCASVVESGERSSPTSAEFLFYLALYVSPKMGIGRGSLKTGAKEVFRPRSIRTRSQKVAGSQGFENREPSSSSPRQPATLSLSSLPLSAAPHPPSTVDVLRPVQPPRDLLLRPPFRVIDSNPDAPSPLLNTNPSSSLQIPLYPSIDYNDLIQNLFFEDVSSASSPSAPPEATEEVLLSIPGAILNLVDKDYNVELACGDFSVIRLRQGDNAVNVYARVAEEIQWPLAKDETAVKVDDSHYFFSFQMCIRDSARVAEEIQWPLAKDETAVKVDDSHYFFSFRVPKGFDPGEEEEDVLSYGHDHATKESSTAPPETLMFLKH